VVDVPQSLATEVTEEVGEVKGNTAMAVETVMAVEVKGSAKMAAAETRVPL